MYYDPMIAKLVTWGRDRNHAIKTMQSALDAFYIRGVSHNIAFVAALMAHERFNKGNLTTNFIAEEYPDGFNPADVPSDNAEVMIAAGCRRPHGLPAARGANRRPVEGYEHARSRATGL